MVFRELVDRVYRSFDPAPLDEKSRDLYVDLDKAGAIKNSPDVRLKIRELSEPDTNNWVDAANDVIGKAKTELNARLSRLGCHCGQPGQDHPQTAPDGGCQPRELMHLVRTAIVNGDFPISNASLERTAFGSRRAYA